jgi:hypothetical protein
MTLPTLLAISTHPDWPFAADLLSRADERLAESRAMLAAPPIQWADMPPRAPTSREFERICVADDEELIELRERVLATPDAATVAHVIARCLEIATGGVQ